MMAHLVAAEQQRLTSMLALAELAANPSEPERLAAIAAAERLLGRHGLRLRDLAVQLRHAEASPPPPPHPTWQATVRQCLAMPGALRPWERQFLGGLQSFPRLSVKQRAILTEIAQRLGVAGAGQ